MVAWQALRDAICDQHPVDGLTHNFYRYPARFSPSFARQAILAFTEPGDLVLDPFMGGGTTIVEALALGRQAVGTDINSLAVFLSQTKSRPLADRQLEKIERWGENLVPKLNLRDSKIQPHQWAKYQKNINTRQTWPIRKLFEISLQHINNLPTDDERKFARCILLRTGQWALDCREVVPSTDEVRKKFILFLHEMISGAREFAGALNDHSFEAICLHRSAVGIEQDSSLRKLIKPKLILTSPPYPGVHVLYHRWQVLGRRESPAPFWIAGSLDGQGASFYTFGGRSQKDLRKYYTEAARAFSSIASLAGKDTIVAQMVAFSDTAWQLPAYLEMMESAGFIEQRISELSNTADGRAWRKVPNRKWYANVNGETPSSTEVVLFHKKR